MDQIHQIVTAKTSVPILTVYATLVVALLGFVFWRWLAGDFESRPISKAPASRSRTLGTPNPTPSQDPKGSTSPSKSHLKSQ